jgi:alpha-ribazole phosphatase
MELYLIRHPKPDVAPDVCYGQLDIGLAEPAQAAADRLLPLLPDKFDLHASPLFRARALAEVLGRPRLDPRLKEMHFGDWEGQSFAEIGEALDAWVADPIGFAAPGGESAASLAERVHDWLEELLDEQPTEPQVIVAHGGPLRAIAGQLLGLPPERWLGLDFACGQVSRLDLFEWGALLRWFNR